MKKTILTLALFSSFAAALAQNEFQEDASYALADEYELSPFDKNIAGHRRSYDMAALIKDFEDAGLEVIKTGGVFYKMLSTPQMNWILEDGHWDEGGFGWGRVGEENTKDWRKAFCDACYQYGKQRAEDCNVIYAIGQIKG